MEKLSIAIEDWGLYNNGILACKWWEYDIDINEVREYYMNLRKKYNIEPYYDLELFCADWENDFLNQVSENANIQKVFNIYNKLDIDNIDLDALEFLTSYQNINIEEALENLEDIEVYEVSSFSALAEQFVDDGLFGDVPSNLINYLDYDAIGRDLSFDYTEYKGKIYRVD